MRDAETIEACPDCGDARIAVRMASRKHAHDNNASRYRCKQCGYYFDDPVIRERLGEGSRKGLSKRLADLDPDDVGIRTDGGRTMSTADTAARHNGPPRPVCHHRNCTELADRVLMKRLSAAAPAFPYCSSHAPDLDAYGNRTTWDDQYTLEVYGREQGTYAIYGRTGASSNPHGRVLHIEDPRGDSVLCEWNPSDRRRYKLSHEFPDGYYRCGKCVETTSWLGEYGEEVAVRFVRSLRSVLKRHGQLPDRATRYIRYRRPDSVCNHAIAEGGQP